VSGPRDQEERRQLANVVAVTPKARDAESKRQRPDLAVATPAERAVDAESARIIAGLR